MSARGMPSTSHAGLPLCSRCRLCTANGGGICTWCLDGRPRQPWDGNALAYKLLFGAAYRQELRDDEETQAA